jgi:uncharacterized membrane protein YkoI
LICPGEDSPIHYDKNFIGCSSRNHVGLHCYIGDKTPPKQIKTNMKSKHIITSTLAVALLVAALVGCATEQEQQAKLAAMAKVSRAAAEQTALAKVPGGTIKDGELEKEKGKLIWSFDISIPGSADIKEVAVDAITGAVLSVETETPAQQAKEKEEDEKKEKQK